MPAKAMFGVLIAFMIAIVSTGGCSSVELDQSQYIVVVDSLTVQFEDDRSIALTLRKGDVVHVDGDYDEQSFRVHVGDRGVIVPKTSVRGHAASESTGATGAGQVIKTGPRGGKYYINSSGKKTYVKSKK